MQGMLKPLFFLLFFSSLFGCSSNPPNIEESLTHSVIRADEVESNTAALLLGDIAITEQGLKRLKTQLRKTPDYHRKLAISYALAKGAMYRPYTVQFIELVNQNPEYLLHSKHNIKSIYNPMLDYLSFQAPSHDSAIIALLRISQHADASNLEAIGSMLKEVSEYQKDKLYSLAIEEGVDLDIIKALIMED